MSTVKQVFAKMKSKLLKADKMEQLLHEEGLTSEEAKQAISLAIPKEVIRVCYPYVEEIRGDRCYELLTEKDKELDRESEAESFKKRRPQKNPKNRVSVNNSTASKRIIRNTS